MGGNNLTSIYPETSKGVGILDSSALQKCAHSEIRTEIKDKHLETF